MIRDGDNELNPHTAGPGATVAPPGLSRWARRAAQGDLAPGERIGAVLIIAVLTAVVLVLLLMGARELTDVMSTLLEPR